MRSVCLCALFACLLCAAGSTAAAPPHAWSARYGGTSNDVARGVAIDASGNVFVTGLFNGSANFGGAGLASAGGTDVFVAKYDASGAHQWSRSFGSTGADAGRGITVDDSGGVIVTGYFVGVVDFGGGNLTSAGGNDVFIARFDTDGNHFWSRRVGGTGSDNGLAVVTTASDDIIVTGFFSSTAEFALPGPASVTHTSAGSTDGFVAAYSSAGAFLWSRAFGGAATDEGLAVCVDGSDVVVGGDFWGEAVFGNPADPLVSAGFNDMFVARYDASGNFMSKQRYGGLGNDYCYAIAAVPGGGYVLGGSFSRTADFGGGPIDSAGGQDIVLSKFTSAAAHIWSRTMGAAGDDYAFAVGVDGSGLVTMSGGFQGPADFGAGLVLSSGVQDVFIATYDAGGAFQWIRTGGNVSTDLGYAVAVGGPGSIVAAGYFRTSINLGGADLVEIGGQDVYVAKYSTAATPVPSAAVAATLAQNAPNPFNPVTTIHFTLASKQNVTLAIHDTTGRQVRRLANGPRESGSHAVVWDGRDDRGNALASGVYFYRLTAGSFSESRKMVLLK